MSASEGKLESGFDLRVGNLSVDVRKVREGWEAPPPPPPMGILDDDWTTAKIIERRSSTRRRTRQGVVDQSLCAYIEGQTSRTHYWLRVRKKQRSRRSSTFFFRFVHFPNDEEAERAERALSGTMFFGRLLQVRERTPPTHPRRLLIGSRISFILDRSRSASFQQVLGCGECFYSTTCECYRRSKGRIPKRNVETRVSRAGGTTHRGT